MIRSIPNYTQAVDLLNPSECEAAIRRSGPVGRQVAWRCFGDGPPLVLLHGGHGSWRHWTRNLQALSVSRRLWVADMPGFGDSDLPAESTLEGLLTTLADAVDDALGSATRFDLSGFSFGGIVAAHLAARCGRVDRLALLGSGGHGTARRPRGELLNWRHALADQDDSQLRAVMRHNLLVHMLHDPASVDDVALDLHTDACLRTRFRSTPISLSGGLRQCLDAYDGPVMLAWGEHDVTVTPQLAIEAMTTGRTRCEAVIVPNSGHWVQYEAADVVNGLLASFLATS